MFFKRKYHSRYYKKGFIARACRREQVIKNTARELQCFVR